MCQVSAEQCLSVCTRSTLTSQEVEWKMGEGPQTFLPEPQETDCNHVTEVTIETM